MKYRRDLEKEANADKENNGQNQMSTKHEKNGSKIYFI